MRRAALAAALAVALGVVQPLQAQNGSTAKARLSARGVLVLNGTYRVALADHVASALTRRGFVVKHLARPWVADAPRAIHITRIYFDPTQSSARLAARALRQNLLGRVVLAGPSTKPIARLAKHAGQPQLVLVLGSSFAGLR